MDQFPGGQVSPIGLKNPGAKREELYFLKIPNSIFNLVSLPQFPGEFQRGSTLTRIEEMRFFNKYYFLGLGSGVALTFFLLFLFAIILIPSPEDMEAMLEPPDFPNSSQVPVYGQTDFLWSVQNLEEMEIPLSQFEGKIVFINFWATWCGPCVSEMPSIQNLYDSLKDEDLSFLLISDEDGETVRDFMEKKQFSFPVYLRGPDVPIVFESDAIPTTFIIDRDGRIVLKHVGSAKWDDESTLHFLRSLL